MTKKRVLAAIFLITGTVFFLDELWMLGVPFGHILPDLSQFHIAPFGIEYHHWMTGVILLILALFLFDRDRKSEVG